MYKLSRLLLIIAAIASFYTVVLIAICWPLGGIVAVVVTVAVSRRGYAQLTTLGSARWANQNDLRRAGMIDADSGILLGRLLPACRRSKMSALISLLNWRLSAKQACSDFKGALFREPGPLVRLPNAIHTAIFSPSGGGKGVSFIIPFLRTCLTSCVVIDFKGENARLTAEFRRTVLGHRVVLLDPYCEVTQTPDSFDPLQFIDKTSSEAIDDCRDVANAVVARTGEEKEPHWNDAAEIIIAAVIAVVVFYGNAEDGTGSLQAVRDILSSPQKFDLAIKLMLESTVCDGMLRRMGGQLLNFIDKEKSSTLTTVTRHLRFLDTPAIAKSTATSSFDPAELRSGKLTVYLILPAHRMAQSSLLRVWISSLLRAVVRAGLLTGA